MQQSYNVKISYLSQEITEQRKCNIDAEATWVIATMQYIIMYVFIYWTKY